MGSSGNPDKSLGAGISLPQWMKGKMDARYDFDDNSFSPPSHDDSFFYIRYPKKVTPQPSQEGFRPISEVLSETNSSITSANQVTATLSAVSNYKAEKQVDFSKHPLPCQPYVPNAASNATDARPPKSAYAGKLKSQGTDDGFHGEPALCGKSIVHVANQMMSGKVTKGFSMDLEGSLKKGSKSLPATPLTSPISTPDNSPKSRRKAYTNRYFTGAFLPDKDSRLQGGWILASLLGQPREPIPAKIEEEDEGLDFVAPRNLSRKKSISTQNLVYSASKEDKPPGNKNVYTNVFQAKPSELREMNFWSPTSM